MVYFGNNKFIFVREGLRFLLDAFFPIECLACGSFGEYLCANCLESFEVFPRQASFIFGQKKITVNFSFPHTEPVIRSLIHLLKYSGAVSLAKPIARLIFRSFDENFWKNFDCLVPIPLHPRRLSKRGYNQAAVIARELSLLTGLPMAEIIERKVSTRSQAELGKEARLENIKGAFSLSFAAVSWFGRRFLLVDDVATTGATFSSAANVLENLQPKNIEAVSLTHGY